MTTHEIRHFHLFCGLGGGARGMNAGDARVGQLQARFRCIGGVDSSPAAVRDFERLAEAPGTVLDLFSREQYVAFHGHEPPDEWREAGPDDLRRAAGGERPNIVFTSPPCKGFSGLLSEASSRRPKYQALNGLTLRGVFLALTAWEDDPPEFFLLENVPRIQSRGRHLVDEITAMLRTHGYSVAETTHDCGEIGGLGQRRKRFLMVARHREKVPPFLYEPPRRPLQSVGQVIGGFALPEDPSAGPMHALPRLHWKTWVRLALVEAGGDWRSLEHLRIEDGQLADYAIVPETCWHAGVLGVTPWDSPNGAVTGEAWPTTGSFSVADPRTGYTGEYAQYGVTPWSEPSGAITAGTHPGQGRNSVADPRQGCDATDTQHRRFNNCYRVIEWERAAQAVTGGGGPSAGGQAVADPRTSARDGGDWSGSNHYGIVPWGAQSGAIVGAARHDNGAFSVADPRVPDAGDRLVAVIRALDNTWHRPFTTLELAALQGLVTPDELVELDGSSHSAWRERVGNAVPAPAAAAIASEMGRAILLARAGETFVLSSTPIWARDLAIAIAVQTAEGGEA